MTQEDLHARALQTTRFAIRAAREDDAGDLAGLMTQLDYPSTEAEMRIRLRRALAHPEYAAWVAVAGRVVGFAGACTGFSFVKTETYGRVLALVVDEGARGMGMGTALLAEAERWMDRRGAESVLVNSSSYRIAAHRFYERLGYEITGVRLIKSLRTSEPTAPIEHES